jgi:eukaryotic-like serine/threonine-protein kinase
MEDKDKRSAGAGVDSEAEEDTLFVGVGSSGLAPRHAVDHPTPSAVILDDETIVRHVVGAAQRTSSGGIAGMSDLFSATETFEDRFEDLGLLGKGGMGEVRRVRDKRLNRVVAMKILKERALRNPISAARFVEEAQACAQLQHPGIVAIYDLGLTPDKRPYFAMREVKGRNLASIIRDVHRKPKPSEETKSEADWTFEKLIQVMHKICETVGYAHSRNVLHRDLKPGNIMIGSHGEVSVVDWGIAKIMSSDVNSQETRVVTHRSSSDEFVTRIGEIAGTPAYMSPEQALGQIPNISTRSDVYSLGAILYEMICGLRPYHGLKPMEALVAVANGPPRHPGTVWSEVGGLAGNSTQAVPDSLVEICLRAMNPDSLLRFVDANETGVAVGNWLEGSLRGQDAKETLKRLRSLRAERTTRGEGYFSELESEAGDAFVSGNCGKTRVVEELLYREDAEDARHLALLRSALETSPDDFATHLEFVSALQETHGIAHRRRDTVRARSLSETIRLEREWLAEHQSDQPQLEAAVNPTGTLNLSCDPVGARVELHRLVEEGEVVRASFERTLGTTPLCDLSIPVGPCLIVVRAAGYVEARFPAFVRENEDVLRSSEGVAGQEIRMLPVQEAEEGDVCIPAGWFFPVGSLGGRITRGRPERTWVDSIVMKRFPTTNREFLAFLNAIEGSSEERNKEFFRLVGASPSESAFECSPTGAYRLRSCDRYGMSSLALDAPVIGVSWDAATAYCEWYSTVTNSDWRLPFEREWEKAALGCDGRRHPWGDFWRDGLCAWLGEESDRLGPTVVKSFPHDCSVYGVRGLAGNVSDWCLDVLGEVDISEDRSRSANPTVHVVRGGNWTSPSGETNSTRRMAVPRMERRASIGFRLCRSLV